MVLPVALALAGCPSVGPVTPDDAAAGATGVARQVVTAHGTAPSSTGCEIDYAVYRGSDRGEPVEVVLGHGFLRSKERMQELARRLAGQGVTTLTLDFCNMRPWDGGHRANAADMVQLAQRLGDGRVVYAGFSAGGLAAVLAAGMDRGAAGVFALDLVDRDRIGERAAATLDVPLRGLYGEPSSCNAGGNGRAVFASAARANSEKVPQATHCDFEAPTDALCRLVCEPAERSAEQAEAIRESILQRSTRAIRELVEAAGPRKAALR